MTVFKKSLITLGIAAFGFTTLFVISIMIFMNSLYYETNTMRLKDAAKSLITAIGEDEITGLFKTDAATEISLPVTTDGAYRLTLIDPSGFVLWDSHVTGRLVNHIDRNEIVAALEGREESVRRNSNTMGMKLIYYAMPIAENGNVIGVFRLSVQVPGFISRLSSVFYPFFLFTIFMAIIIFVAIYAFSRSLSTSIVRLVGYTQAGASLLSGPEAEEPVAPEFQSLEKAIRAMTSELTLRLEQAKTEGQRLEAILNGMSEAVFAMDPAMKLHLVNPKAREIFNLKNRDINTMTLLEATHSTELTEIARKALNTETTLEMDLTLRSGTEQNFKVFAAPLAKGNIASISGGVVLVLQDITQLVKLERIRKDFVANVSHELRTPIQLIKGFSETLLDTVDDKQSVHFIKIIRKNANNMENLTNDLLILADLENNAINGRDMEETDIAPLIDEAVSSVQPQAERKKIEIVTECPNDLRANVYGSFIIQALINMTDNAIKYSPEKSKVRVSAFLENSKQGFGSELVLQVKDKGIGITAEHIDRIFERFYRVDRSRSKEAGGTGLGLSIVRHIAMLHKGKAEAESHAGEGSVFRIRLPQNYSSPPPSEPSTLSALSAPSADSN
jgi:two-component system phosphate regulon sensor histidine kinase PhoR